MDLGQLAENVAVLGGLTGYMVAFRAFTLGAGDYCHANIEYQRWLTPERREEVGKPRLWEHVEYYFRETVPLVLSLVKPGWLYEVRLDKPFLRYANMDRQSRRHKITKAAARWHLPIPDEEYFKGIGL